LVENPSASEWGAARGEKWRDQLVGMEAMLKPVDGPLLGALQLEAPCRIVDVGCGGGGTALEILRRAPAGSVVHGFDVSPALVESARERTRPDARALAFDVADMATATPDQAYDRMVSRFGIMFFDEPDAAFANLLRWLTPGGRFAFAAWGRPADNPWMTTVRDAVAEVIDVPPPDPEAPGPFRYGDADKLLTLLDRAGFGALGVHDWRGPLRMGGGMPPAEAARFAFAAFSSFGELLAAAGGDAFTKAHRILTECFSRHETGSVVQMDACVHIFTGVRA
jgi:SAM-dependent methyltransferase